jgi:hypothetical protein
LRHYATNRKVAGSIPGVIGIFHWHNPSGCNVALGSSQPLTRVPGLFPGGEGGRCVELTTLPPSCANCLEIWEPQPPGILRACPEIQWDCFTLLPFRSFYLLSFALSFHLSINAGNYFFFFTFFLLFFRCLFLLSSFLALNLFRSKIFPFLSYLSLATSFNS